MLYIKSEINTKRLTSHNLWGDTPIYPTYGVASISKNPTEKLCLHKILINYEFGKGFGYIMSPFFLKMKLKKCQLLPDMNYS